MREFSSDLLQGQIATGAGGTFDGELVSVVAVECLQSLDKQVVDGEPDGAAPVGVAAEEAGLRLRRFVSDGMRHAINVERVGMVGMVLAKRANAVIGEKFVRREHAAQQLFHAMAAYQRQQATLTGAGLLPVG